MTEQHKKVIRVEKTYWDMTHEEKYAYIKGSLEGFSPNEEVRARAKQPLSKDADLQSVSHPKSSITPTSLVATRDCCCGACCINCVFNKTRK